MEWPLVALLNSALFSFEVLASSWQSRRYYLHVDTIYTSVLFTRRYYLHVGTIYTSVLFTRRYYLHVGTRYPHFPYMDKNAFAFCFTPQLR